MAKIRVLVADDSAVIRQQVSGWLAAEPDLDVASTAANGRQAVERFQARRPDAVLLDVDMPEMDGLAALRAIRAADARVPVIMFSAMTQRGGTVTLDALSMGASDYVLKPGRAGPAQVSPEEVRAQLLEKIRRLHERAVAPPAPTARQALEATLRPAPRPPAPRARRERIDAVVIGSSTGGPNALEAIFRALPGDLPVPILIVQHMPPLFTRSLADRLSRHGKIPVREATEGAFAQPGTAWIAPGGYHLALERRGAQVALRVNEEPPENSCRPSVDVLFRAAASIYGANALAVVLTGMGQDGLAGARQLVDAGAEVLAQDEATSVVWGMPGAVTQAGLASRVLPIEAIADEIARRVRAAPRMPERTP